MRTNKAGLILVAHRIPADVTPVSMWLADVAERVVLITSEEAAPGYAGQFSEVIPVADYSTSDAVVHHIDRLCVEHTVSSLQMAGAILSLPVRGDRCARPCGRENADGAEPGPASV